MTKETCDIGWQWEDPWAERVQPQMKKIVYNALQVKETYIYVKETYIYVKETYIYVKETYIYVGLHISRR